METRLLAYDQAETVGEIAAWVNTLIGKEAPGEPAYTIVRVVNFQLLNAQSRYDAMFLVEVSERPPDIALSEADIEVIEELTLSVENSVKNPSNQLS